MSKPEKILVTHYDLDGVVSAIILDKIFNFDQIKKGGYGKFDRFVQEVPEGSIVVASDVELGLSNMGMLKEKCKRVKLIDHHPKTEETKKLYPDDVIYSGDKSGSLLCFGVYKSAREKNNKKVQKEILLLAYAVNGYDLFKYETEPKWFAFGYDLNILFWEYHFDTFFERFKNGFDGFTEKEKKFIKNKRKKIKEDINGSDAFDFTVGSCTAKVCVPSTDGLVNDVPFHFNHEHDLYFIIQKFPKSINISVRTKDIDLTQYIDCVSTVHGVLSSGGHPQACGITLAYNSPDEIVIDAINVLHQEVAHGVYSQEQDEIPF